MSTTAASAAVPTSTTKADRRRSMGAARARDDAASDAYEAGRAGRARPEAFGDDKTVRAAYNQGRRETAAATAREALSGAASHLAGAGRTVAGADVLGGTWTGVLSGVLLVIILYLFLKNTSLATSVINGFSAGLRWLISPSTLPI